MTLAQAADLAFLGRFSDADHLLAHEPPVPEAVWLRSYVAAAQGDFARADRLAREILDTPPASAASKARAAATLGSVLRQRDRHAEARVVEEKVLPRAPSSELRAHLLIGLAADAVGLGDLAEVDDTLRRVPRAGRDWRVRVRLAWVRCERELLVGRPGAAVRHARDAADLAARHRAVRHVAKSHLFLGAALLEVLRRDPTRPDLTREARRALRRAHALATRIGARPIAAVATDLLGRLGRASRG